MILGVAAEEMQQQFAAQLHAGRARQCEAIRSKAYEAAKEGNMTTLGWFWKQDMSATPPVFRFLPCPGRPRDLARTSPFASPGASKNKGSDKQPAASNKPAIIMRTWRWSGGFGS